MARCGGRPMPSTSAVSTLHAFLRWALRARASAAWVYMHGGAVLIVASYGSTPPNLTSTVHCTIFGGIDQLETGSVCIMVSFVRFFI